MGQFPLPHLLLQWPQPAKQGVRAGRSGATRRRENEMRVAELRRDFTFKRQSPSLLRRQLAFAAFALRAEWLYVR